MAATKYPEDTNVLHTLLRIIYSAVTFVITVIIVPILLPLSLLFRIYRNVLQSVMKNKMGDDVTLAGGQDAVWLQDAPNNRAIINALLAIKGKPQVELYHQLMCDRMVNRKDPDNPNTLVFPKLSMYTAKILRRYVWMKEEKFDIKEHVYFYEKAAPKSKDELEKVVGVICSKGLPSNKSPWEMILLPQVEGEDEFLVVFRVHHSIGDGISLVKSFVNGMADNPPEEVKSHRFGAQGKLFRILKSIFQGPGYTIARLFKPKDTNILHGPVPTGQKLVSWSKQIDLDLIKRMKNATKTTVNDVLLSCLAGALREYIQNNSTSIPSTICSSVPVDIRQSKKLQMDNQFAIVFLDLPLDEDDPVTLLRRTKKRMDQIKTSPEPLVNNLMISYMMARIPNFITEIVLNWLTDKCSMILSNVPGPTEMLRVNGQDVDDLIFWPPQRKNVSLGISILSYNNHLRIGIMVDKAVLTNPSVLSDLFVKRIERLASDLKIE